MCDYSREWWPRAENGAISKWSLSLREGWGRYLMHAAVNLLWFEGAQQKFSVIYNKTNEGIIIKHCVCSLHCLHFIRGVHSVFIAYSKSSLSLTTRPMKVLSLYTVSALFTVYALFGEFWGVQWVFIAYSKSSPSFTTRPMAVLELYAVSAHFSVYTLIGEFSECSSPAEKANLLTFGEDIPTKQEIVTVYLVVFYFALFLNLVLFYFTFSLQTNICGLLPHHVQKSCSLMETWKEYFSPSRGPCRSWQVTAWGGRHHHC